MARQIINVGTKANDGTGDPLRTGMTKINQNFAELYGNLQIDPSGSGTVTVTNANVSGNVAAGGYVSGNHAIFNYLDSTVIGSTDAAEAIFTEVQVLGNLTVSGKFGGPALTSNTTYYVRPDGNDSNNGLANTTGGAFATIQAAVEKVSTVETNGFDVTIQVADGTYTTTQPIRLPVVNTTGKVSLFGNKTTPANCSITIDAPLAALTACPGSIWYVGGFKLSGHPNQSNLLELQPGSQVSVDGNMEFGTGSAHIYVDSGATFTLWGGDAAPVITVSGDAYEHVYSKGYCYYYAAQTVFAPAVAYNFLFFARAVSFGLISFYWDDATAFIGNNVVHGYKYKVEQFALIDTAGLGTDFLPGDAAGTVIAPGAYT